MYSVVDATPDGRIVLWRTRAPDVGAPPPPGAFLVTPWGEAVPAPETCPPKPPRFTDDPHRRRRKIADGEVFFVRDGDSFYVVKRQRLHPPEVDDVVTPRPPTCETKALATLNDLMRTRRIAPVFCELWAGTATPPPPGELEITMCAYVADIADWVRSGAQRASAEPGGKTIFDFPAHSSDHWLYTRCAGNHLLTSPFPSDKTLFNDTLRATLLQVFLGLAQAQHHCLFAHNDLHSGNVMFEHCPRGVSRLFVTGVGAFLLPRRAARVRIIDFQHATFDVYDAQGGACVGRVCGCRDDVHNSFALVYDVWRFCSHLVLEVLRPHHGALDEDVLDLLREGAHLRRGEALPKMAPEVHWKPYLLDGPTPEDMLAHRAFDRYRASAAAPADEIYFERPPGAEQQARFLQTRLLRYRGITGAPPRPVARTPPPQLAARLAVFAQNYEGTAMGSAALYHKHSAAARIRFLFMEVCLLRALLDHLWSPTCAEEVARRAGSDAELCALADGIGVVLHADVHYIARPESIRDYNDMVIAAARLPCVQAAYASPVGGSGLAAATEDALLAGTRDGDVERFRGLFIAMVQGT